MDGIIGISLAQLVPLPREVTRKDLQIGCMKELFGLEVRGWNQYWLFVCTGNVC